MVKNPNWQEADQLAIYLQMGRGVELGSTKEQLQHSCQSRTWTHDLWISSPVYGGLKKHTTNAQNMIGQSAADTGTAVTWAQLFSSTLM